MASTLKVDQIETPSGVGNISFAQPISGDGSQLTGVGLAVGGGAVVAGDFLYHDGVEWTRLPKGTAAQYLRMNAGATAPEWIATSGAGIQEPASSAAGDILYYDGSNYVRLAKGTAAQTLAMNSGATAPEWIAPAGGGKVLQCIQEHVIAQSSQSVTAGGYQNITNLNKAITPTESDSNILVDIRYTGELDHTSPADLIFGINRDSTAIGNPSASGSHPIGIASWLITGNTPGTTQFSTSYRYLDTGRSAGTSAITYYASCQFQYAVTLYNNRTKNNTNDRWNEFMTSTIILWEISA